MLPASLSVPHRWSHVLSFGELFALFSEVAVPKANLLWGVHTCVLLVVLVAGSYSLPIALSGLWLLLWGCWLLGGLSCQGWSSLLIQQLYLTFVLRHFGTSALLICGRVAL